MALIRGVRKILKEEFPQADNWFYDFLSLINVFIDSVIIALRNKLTFKENFYCEILEYNFTHNTEVSLKTSLNTFSGAIVLNTPQDEGATIVTGHKARYLSTGQIGVTILFSGAGSTQGTVKIMILG